MRQYMTVIVLLTVVVYTVKDAVCQKTLSGVSQIDGDSASRRSSDLVQKGLSEEKPLSVRARRDFEIKIMLPMELSAKKRNRGRKVSQRERGSKVSSRHRLHSRYQRIYATKNKRKQHKNSRELNRKRKNKHHGSTHYRINTVIEYSKRYGDRRMDKKRRGKSYKKKQKNRHHLKILEKSEWDLKKALLLWNRKRQNKHKNHYHYLIKEWNRKAKSVRRNGRKEGHNKGARKDRKPKLENKHRDNWHSRKDKTDERRKKGKRNRERGKHWNHLHEIMKRNRKNPRGKNKRVMSVSQVYSMINRRFPHGKTTSGNSRYAVLRFALDKRNRKRSRLHNRKGSRLHKHKGSRLHKHKGSLQHKRKGSRLHNRKGSRQHKRKGSRQHKRKGSRQHKRKGGKSRKRKRNGHRVYHLERSSGNWLKELFGSDKGKD